MTEAEAAAQRELREVVQDLNAAHTRLEKIHARLPVPAEETAMPVGEQEIDMSAEIRSVIECVLNDSLRPAIRDLAAAASSRPREKDR